jgi:hypothetical protein
MKKIERNELVMAQAAGGCNKGSSARNQTVVIINVKG